MAPQKEKKTNSHIMKSLVELALSLKFTHFVVIGKIHLTRINQFIWIVFVISGIRARTLDYDILEWSNGSLPGGCFWGSSIQFLWHILLHLTEWNKGDETFVFQRENDILTKWQIKSLKLLKVVTKSECWHWRSSFPIIHKVGNVVIFMKLISAKWFPTVRIEPATLQP